MGAGYSPKYVWNIVNKWILPLGLPTLNWTQIWAGFIGWLTESMVKKQPAVEKIVSTNKQFTSFARYNIYKTWKLGCAQVFDITDHKS